MEFPSYISNRFVPVTNIVKLLVLYLTLSSALPLPPGEIDPETPFPNHPFLTRALSRRDGLPVGGIIGLVLGGGAAMVLLLLCATKLGRRH